MKKQILNERSKKLFLIIKESWLLLLLSMGCLLVVAGTTALTAYLIKPVLDDVFVDKNYSMLMLLSLSVVAVYFIKGIATYGQEYIMGYVGQKIIKRFRDELYSHIQDLPLAFFHKEKTGVLMSRITNDVNIVKNMVTSAITGSVKDFFTIIGLTCVIFYMIPKLAIFAFLVLPIAYYPIVAIGRRIRKIATGSQETMADMNAFLQETFLGNKIVKAFKRENYEKERFYKKSRKLFKLEVKEIKTKAISSPLMEFLGGIGGAFIIWYGGEKVISGVYTVGTFMSFLGAIIMLYGPIKKLTKLNNAVQKGLSATDRIFDVLEHESDIVENENPVAIEKKAHNVSFNNVSFRYEEDMVLKNISLNVKPGEVLALAGASGGGKTSLVNLIPRFYDVSDGAVMFDDIDIRNASLSSLRENIAIVTQEPILFNDTVKNNIAYGRQDASEEEIVQAAKAAFAYDFIQKFTDKFETSIGELGGRLSGGEKQRICIARALLKDAPVLILDEATSSLDAESEMLVQKALENLMKGRTTFIIAHRLSTIGYADRIIVVINGRIVEEGGHQELIDRKGEYFKLYNLQFGNENQ
ncbi:MAG: ABC transporter ATP-binding protein [Deltaproteobacteria bacterium]|nr:ABC transporter ATP-binding protein [Deltaproteobacteria bacterium]MBW2363716.1 ABC transporter ATP-binding protein [Deltaproteobacteria bacterium]